jgi:hypothetical protein
LPSIPRNLPAKLTNSSSIRMGDTEVPILQAWIQKHEAELEQACRTRQNSRRMRPDVRFSKPEIILARGDGLSAKQMTNCSLESHRSPNTWIFPARFCFFGVSSHIVLRRLSERRWSTMATSEQLAESRETGYSFVPIVQDNECVIHVQALPVSSQCG